MAAIGVNWAEVWKPVWKAVWTSVAPVAEETRRQQGAGKPSRTRKRRFVVEIDGEDHLVSSKAEAQELLDQVEQQAKQAAELALARAAKATTKPVRKVMHDARKALQPPQITVPKALATITERVLTSVQSLYDSTMRDIEIAALFRRAQLAEEDDEDVLMLLL